MRVTTTSMRAPWSAVSWRCQPCGQRGALKRNRSTKRNWARCTEQQVEGEARQVEGKLQKDVGDVEEKTDPHRSRPSLLSANGRQLPTGGAERAVRSRQPDQIQSRSRTPVNLDGRMHDFRDRDWI